MPKVSGFCRSNRRGPRPSPLQMFLVAGGCWPDGDPCPECVVPCAGAAPAVDPQSYRYLRALCVQPHGAHRAGTGHRTWRPGREGGCPTSSGSHGWCWSRRGTCFGNVLCRAELWVGRRQKLGGPWGSRKACPAVRCAEEQGKEKQAGLLQVEKGREGRRNSRC